MESDLAHLPASSKPLASGGVVVRELARRPEVLRLGAPKGPGSVVGVAAACIPSSSPVLGGSLASWTPGSRGSSRRSRAAA